MLTSRLSTPWLVLRRGYATNRETRSSSSTNDSDRDQDLCLTRWPTNPRCTPYDVLEQTKGGNYNKRRFYELVKIYHPDRWRHTTYHGVSKHVRVERYRLIVAANRILSDPTKRKAYDERGIGWDAGPGASDRAGAAGCDDGKAYNNVQRGPFDKRSTDASKNATWEDWERWRCQDIPPKQGTVFLCNRSFALILALFALVGGCAQLVRADHIARRVGKRHSEIHEMLSDELWHIQNRSLETSPDRRLLIEAFLRRRLEASVGHETSEDGALCLH